MQPGGETGDGEEAYDESEHSQTDLFSPAVQLSSFDHVGSCIGICKPRGDS